MPGKKLEDKRVTGLSPAEVKRLSGPGTFRVEGCRGAFFRGARYKRNAEVTLLEGEMAGPSWVRIDREERKTKESGPPKRPDKQSLSEVQQRGPDRAKPIGA